MKRPLAVLAGAAVVLLLAGAATQAGHVMYQSCGPFVTPIPGCKVPTPCEVPGKEYSNHVDKDMQGNPDPLQVLAWDGQGGVMDTFDYSDTETYEVDALANCQDALYHAVINDQATLLWSTETDPNIYRERPGPCACQDRAIWAPAPIVNASTYDDTTPHLNDVDGLEVWGPELQDDSNRYSLAGDIGGVAVWAYDGAAVSTAWLADAAIVAALSSDMGIDIPVCDIDLDAMMTWDADCDDLEFDLTADSIMFSLAPVTGILDGGEIFVWDAAGMRYLKHGCHLWDTTFVVEGYAGSYTENVNALEAVSTPEPVTLIGLAMGVSGLARYVRRRRR